MRYIRYVSNWLHPISWDIKSVLVPGCGRLFSILCPVTIVSSHIIFMVTCGGTVNQVTVQVQSRSRKICTLLCWAFFVLWLYYQFVVYSSDTINHIIQGLYSQSGRTSYRMISWSLEAARFIFTLSQSLCNLTGTSETVLPRCLSNCRTIWLS